MIFALSYLVAILFPGFLISRQLNIRKQIVLFSVSFSLVYFVSLLFIAIAINISVSSFFIFYIAGLLFFCVSNILQRNNSIHLKNEEKAGYLIVFISTVIYLFCVGFYDELPSDVYKHLEYFKETAAQIETGNFAHTTGFALFDKSVQYWYHLPVLTTKILKTDFLTNIEFFAAINVTVLLICIYEFSNFIFQKIVSRKIELISLSLLSVFFFATHFGINVFAFIRYYAIAPTILNYVIYLSAIVCLFSYYRFEFGLLKFALTTGFLFVTAYLIHAQEAIFIGIIYITVTFIILFTNKSFKIKLDQQIEKLPNSLIPLSTIILLIGCLAYLYTINKIPFSNINKPKIIDLSKYFGLGEDNFILNPKFQFYTVLTHWGFYIYALYLFYYKKYFSNQPLLLAGMLIPVLTVFNPLFTSFFLRVGYSDVLWRFLYMLPLYLVAARLVAGICFSAPQKILTRATSGFIVLLIFLFLLPIKLPSIDLPYSRIYSLDKPHYQARASFWEDMLEYLQNLSDKEKIITDPITSYMINALTKHKNRSYKFYKWRLKDDYLFEDYTTHPLEKYKNRLLIINRRKGMSTKTAKLAQHWPVHALKLTDYYNNKLLDHIKSESEHFNLLWEADDIKIYRISY